MSRRIVVMRSAGLIVTVPIAVMVLYGLGATVLRFGTGDGRGIDLVQGAVAGAALVLLNVAMVARSPARPAASLVAHLVLAPLAAWCCYIGSVDPVVLPVGLLLLAVTVAMLHGSVRPLQGAVRPR